MVTNENKIFLQRQQALLQRLEKDAIVVLVSATPQIRNRDVEYPFRQESDFFYLTGLTQASTIALLTSDQHGKKENYTIFCLPKDRDAEIWTGPRISHRTLRNQYGANQAYSLAQFDEHFADLSHAKKVCYFTQSVTQNWSWQASLKRLLLTASPSCRLLRAEPYIHELRLRKSPEELRLMERAAEISAHAHRCAMQMCRAGLYEYEIEAVFEYIFKKSNAHSAYPSIVGGGKNACVLHYTANQSRLHDGDLLLIDAAAEFKGYAADITRTFPVNGKFSAPQRALYEIVLHAQEQAIKQVRPGNSFHGMHQTAVTELSRGLRDLGLLKGPLSKLIEQQAYRRFYMHHTGHWLGMDVHDVGSYEKHGRSRCFETGMVTTVEPGLYIPAADDIPKRWWNTGIRIEDDVVVTSSGPRVISSQVAKDVGAIESLMQQGQPFDFSSI